MPDRLSCGTFTIYGLDEASVVVDFGDWDAANHWWETVTVTVNSLKSFAGTGRGFYLRSEDVDNLWNQLRLRIEEHSFDDLDMELAVGALRISFRFDKTGHVAIGGVLLDQATFPDQRLDFRFKSDQSLLTRTLAELEQYQRMLPR